MPGPADSRDNKRSGTANFRPVRPDRRIPELDGVRGIAILLVLVWHYLQNQLRPETGTPLAYFKQAIGFTWSGVDLFFVLSGFLIAGILLDKRDAPNYFRAFYARRICRIFPLYYINLGIFLMLAVFGIGHNPVLERLVAEDGVPFWSYVTYVQNIVMGINNADGPGWLTVTWSLAIEEQFYLFFPLLIRYAPRTWLPGVFIWFTVMAVYLRFTMPGLSAYINTPWRADSLMMGALLAYFMRSPGFIELARRCLPVILLIMLALVTGIGHATINRQFQLGGALTHLTFAVAYALLILVVLLNSNTQLTGIFRSRWLTWLGSISYGVYLLHTGISSLTHGLFDHARPQITSWSDASVTLLALCITLSVAHFSFTRLERSIIRFGHSVKYD
jgi:peptidoglycan/LPS O-acetylase OafA/YrhL